MDIKVVSRRESSKNTKICLKNQQQEDIRLDDNNTTEEVFPWLSKFNKVVRSYAGSRNYQHLEELLLLYTQNILSSVAGSNIKFSSAVNLKNHINNMLIFFHLYWLDIKQDIANHSQYLNKISTLLTVYIDMELKISSSQVRDSSEIAAKIFAAMYIYLNNSEEHIFRVLLRIKHTTEKYTKVCNHIFTKSFTNLKTKTSITDVAYIRYLLAFKMWRKMEETTKKNLVLKKKLIHSDKKERINKLAIMLLGPRMPKLRDELLKFVPRPPIDQEDETLWLIQSNLFDLKQVHKHFLLFEDKMNNSTDLQCTKTIHADQNCSKSQKHQMKEFKPLKKIRKKPIIIETGKPIIIDLTGEKRKKTKRNSECLRVMKNIMKSKKHINSSKYSSKLMNADVKECFNENNKSLGEKIRLECESVYDIKISDSTEKYTSVGSKSSLNDVCHIKELQKNNPLNVTKNQMNNTCLEFVKEDEKQHDYNLHYLKSPMFVNQDIKDFKDTANVLKESKLENCVSPYMTIGSAPNSYNNSITQNKEALTSQEESVMETIPLLKSCQNNIADQHSFKQELPTSTNCSAMQKSHKYCSTMPVDVHDIKHLNTIIKKLKSINDHSSQITEIIKQKVCHQVNECPNCRTKIDRKPFMFTNNDIIAAKAQGTLHDTFNDDENNIKLAADTNIIYTLSDRNKCVFVNHIDERVMTLHEKKEQHLDKSNDSYTVSTTFTEDQIVNNVRMNDYDNPATYSEAMIKEQQKRSNCDSSILNNQLYFSESSTFDINSFDIGSNAEIDYDLKSFPKIGKADEITETDYVDKHVFSNNIQSQTLLDDFSLQSSEQPINYDNLSSVPTKKPLIYTNNDIITVKTQDTLHNIFNNDENDVTTPYNTNIICMLSDRIYITNHTGEHIMTTSAEKRMQCLHNSNDMCTVSTTFTGDQNVESLLGSQRVDSDRRKCGYENDSKYSEDMIKEELGKFDTDSFETDSKEASEIMKTDFENISFLHNNQTLEDILSTDTTNFLPLRQSLFELDNVYTDTSLNEKNVLCNNQNDAIDSSMDLVTSHLNTDNTFLRLV